MNAQRIVDLLEQMIAILSSTGHSDWAPALESLRDEIELSATDSAKYRNAVRSGLALYGGMGSFQDLVLQDRTGVRPEQPEFAALRGDLFIALRNEL